MKINPILINEKERQTMRNALIRRIDTALDSKEPDMDTVDVCSKLLDALEHGSCQPGGKRMRQELSRIAEEIDYIPRANAMVTVKPMTVRGVLVGVLAVCMCLFLLPVTVMLLHRGSQGLAGQESTETTPDADESLCSADTEHIHVWKSFILEMPSGDNTNESERHQWNECTVCGAVESSHAEEQENEETEHVHEWTNVMVSEKDKNGRDVKEVVRVCIQCQEVQSSETTESAAADGDKTNMDEKISFLEDKISEMERKLQTLQEEKQSWVESLEAAAADRDKTDKDEEITFIEEKISEMEFKLLALQEELRSAIAAHEFFLSQYAPEEISE